MEEPVTLFLRQDPGNKFNLLLVKKKNKQTIKPPEAHTLSQNWYLDVKNQTSTGLQMLRF